MVPGAGLEPARYFYRGILSPLRLPIPPPGQRVLRLRLVLACYFLLALRARPCGRSRAPALHGTCASCTSSTNSATRARGTSTQAGTGLLLLTGSASQALRPFTGSCPPRHLCFVHFVYQFRHPGKGYFDSGLVMPALLLLALRARPCGRSRAPVLHGTCASCTSSTNSATRARGTSTQAW